MCGSLGTIAVVTEVAFRLHPAAPASATVVFESGEPAELAAYAAAIRRAPVAPVAVEAAWPDGVVAVRFESTAAGAAGMAEVAAGLALRARTAGDDEAAALWQRLGRRPWDAPGPVAGVGVPLGRVGDLITLARDTGATLALRACVGVGEARVAEGGEQMFAEGVAALGGHCANRRGAFPEPARDSAALALMRAVKAQLDPAGVLSPGRLWSAA
jgi:glycolate oxidase FAD binding subunit